MDRYGVEAMGMMVGEEAYQEFKEAQRRFPGRFIGYANINPAHPQAPKLVKQAARDGFKGIKLYPSSWKDLRAYDPLCYPVYEACRSHKLLVFLHFGVTIGSQADLRGGNPLDIQVPSRDFPEVNFVIAHFGAGFSREAPPVAIPSRQHIHGQQREQHTDEIPALRLGLKKVFKKAIEAAGSRKILFGTDSTFFPRGFRVNILEAQYQAYTQLEKEGLITEKDIHNIFHDNIKRLIGESN